ncbi:MAG: YqgE/AlgH family protein [Polaromonas sp.]|uniref:YqgE/AlgH family protein n=1 Tax=Polaromonas sp. TaxID=1869339 RepID=UPI002733B265|nr:YqgE/AlgH family protein [Polaromonas sp.]MDP3797835.1 YqgE/AlgH family protein [Polaromonas sp.]
MNLTHHFLMAMPGLGDEVFAKSVVCMCEHSDRGVLGPGSESVYASSMTIPGGLEMATPKEVLEALSTGAGPRKVFVSLGSSAWGEGQLESEIPDNSWRTVPAELRYDKALLLPGLHSGMLSSEAGYA